MNVTLILAALQTEGTGEMDMAPTVERAVGFISARLFSQSQIHPGEVQKGWIADAASIRIRPLGHQGCVARREEAVLKAYRRRCQRFPIWLCKYGLRSETEIMFKELQAS